MQLIFKLPATKPPFVGILFDNIRSACTLNQDLVNLRKDEIYFIQLEVRGDKLELCLSFGVRNEKRVYKELSYDLEKTKRFIELTTLNRHFNFSHVIKDYDKEKVVKTLEGHNLFVLKVQGLYLLES